MKTKVNLFVNKYILLLLSICLVSCNDELQNTNTSIEQLNPTNSDASAGTWKPILLSSANEFLVDAPLATTNPAFLREINEIKSYQLNITAEQKKSIAYWSAGGVLRWNEIMRLLVAKHNRPPYQNPDGTYPTPSGANPFANPEFPFSNPPYAARAYAYVSAAQYDALIAAWHYKAVYNRAAPFAVDKNINLLVPQSNLPSYPSEDGVLAGVTVEMLKLFFPTEISFINEKAEEQKLYKIISGANVRSDIEAGSALGRKIAAKYIARAASDGMGAAVGTPAIWLQLENQTIALGETPWKSQEVPARPPMLPLFGKVKSFIMTPQMVTDSRPTPPPSTKSVQFNKELDEVKSYSKNDSRENLKIVSFWADGIGTYTPPGHWNAIAAKHFVSKKYSEVRWARSMALLNIALMDAAISCWDAKYLYFNPRPIQMDKTIKTTTGTPNFPSYVSGHSTFSGAASSVLSYLLPDKTNDFEAMAKQASDSRLFGAIHYRSDCEKGMLLGKTVANFTINKAKSDGAD